MMKKFDKLIHNLTNEIPTFEEKSIDCNGTLPNVETIDIFEKSMEISFVSPYLYRTTNEYIVGKKIMSNAFLTMCLSISALTTRHHID